MMRNLFVGTIFMCCFLGSHAQKTNLKGRIKELTIYSAILQKDRQISVFLPEKYNPKKTYPVVYTTDGQSLPEYADKVDSLISSNQMAAIVIVGVHSDTTPSQEGWTIRGEASFVPMRTVEYIRWENTELYYSKHQQFFLTEVMPYAEKQFNVSTNKNQRVLYGYSNGGGFAFTTAMEHPELFENIIAYAIAVNYEEEIPKAKKSSPNFHLFVGTRDYALYDGNVEIMENLKKQGYNCTWQELDSGHDHLVWDRLFPEQIKKIFKK